MSADQVEQDIPVTSRESLNSGYGRVDGLILAHQEILSDVAQAYEPIEEMYGHKLNQARDCAIRTSRMVDPEAILFLSNRETTLRNMRGNPIQKLSDFGTYWASRVGNEAARGNDISDDLPSVAVGATPTMLHSLRTVTAMLSPAFTQVEHARLTIMENLEDKIGADDSLPVELCEWLASADLQEPSERGFVLVLMSDLAEQQHRGTQTESIINRSLTAYRQVDTGHFLDDFIEECTEQPDEWYRESQLLEFLKSFAKLETTGQLKQRLKSDPEGLPSQLADSLVKFSQLKKDHVTAGIRNLASNYETMPVNPTDDELKASWRQTLIAMPAEALGLNRVEQIKAATAAKRMARQERHARAAAAKLIYTETQEVKQEAVCRRMYRIKRTEAGTYIVDDNEDSAHELIRKYTADFPGEKGLESDL